MQKLLKADRWEVAVLSLSESGTTIIEGPVVKSLGFRNVGEMLASAAAHAPLRLFLEQRVPGGWISLSYRDADRQSDLIANALIARGLGPEKPLAILSQNSIAHALMSLGAMKAGIPVAPISVAYSQSEDMRRLQAILSLLTPGAVFAQDENVCANGFQFAQSLGIPAIVAETERPGQVTSLDDLVDEGRALRAPLVSPSQETVAKVLFTSGSTGAPKGVIVTHGMMCSNQEAILQNWPFLAEEPLCVVDWLPWNHVFGGNLVFNAVVRNAGTLVIDYGRPLHGHFQQTIDNIKRSPPTMHLSVPGSLTELIRAMRTDEDLAVRFFSRLRAIFSAGAALPEATWDQLRELAGKHGRANFEIYIGWGSTETSPVVSITPPDNRHCNNLGAPVAGAAIKLVAADGRTELRLRGPMVTPGYWRNPQATADAFDEDGYYRIGDAGRLVDPLDAGKGVLFDGRVAENFKLTTGTWVQVGKVRVSAISAAAPAIQDAVVAGQDRDEVGLLIFPSLAGCREIAGQPDATLDTLIADPSVRRHLVESLSEMSSGGSSMRIGRAMLMREPPSMGDGEITDKGYLNQRAVLNRRKALVDKLFSELPPAEIIFPSAT
ncbi:AMP-binding protein [Tardiphaga sp. 367_B4_N1_1]|uniref:AMP-binding protein n=1 Tax=Tardiphaga sp. 367_B4_N1_1 TaxID=3240777 RepID=UPI003F20AFB3